MTTASKWSDEAWKAALPVYEAITRMPFIQELIAGTLPQEKFIFYLRQDDLYIGQYSRVLAHIASRAESTEMVETFLAFAKDGVDVEKFMHQSYLKDMPASVEMTPTCRLYTSTLLARQSDPLAVEAAAILPCFWVYWAVGQYILSQVKDLEDHPYRAWIETYSYEGFTESNQRAIDACDELARAATPEVRERMTEIFTLCTRLEWMFWQSAYDMEKWPI